MEKIGIDGLRLWASSIDYSGEAVISDILVRNVQEVLRKTRNTCRFLLSNLYDFNIDQDAIAFENMRIIDQYTLQELFQVNQEILRAYAAYDFTAVSHKLGNYCSVNLSSFYLDIVKDRLYVELPNGHARRSTQTACWYILDTLTRLIAPILSFTAEQISDHYQAEKTASIHLQHFSHLPEIWATLAKKITDSRVGADILALQTVDISALATIDKIVFVAQHEKRWEVIKAIRTATLKAIEQLREQNIIKHPLEARITAYFDDNAPFAKDLHNFFDELQKQNEHVEQFFKELTIVSQFDVVTTRGRLTESIYPGFYLSVERAQGNKCPRCWQWEKTDYEHNLCSRCHEILKQLK